MKTDINAFLGNQLEFAITFETIISIILMSLYGSV